MKRYLYVFGFIVVATIFTKIIFNLLWDVSIYLSNYLVFIDPKCDFMPDLLFKVFICILTLIIILIFTLITKNTDVFVVPQKVFFASLKISIIKILVIFSVIMLTIEITGVVIVKLTGNAALNIPNEPYSFIGFFLAIVIINPIAEEIFFRKLMTSIVIRLFKKIFHNDRTLFIISLLITTIIFTLIHIGIQFLPFEINHLNYPQLVSVALQGGFYYWLYVKSKSIIFPILAHSIANALHCFTNLIIIIL